MSAPLAQPNSPPAAEAQPRRSRLGSIARSPFSLAVLGSVLLWLAQPPAMLGALAWFAPLPWLHLISQNNPLTKRGYLQVWLAGVAYWFMAVWWVSLPHPATPIGLGFLAAYLGVYLALFVAVTRTGVHRFRLPLWLVAPVVWTGLELMQAHLFTGFLMGALSHTQAFSPSMIQIADVVGAYGVSFVLMLGSAGLAEAIFWLRNRRDPQLLPLNPKLPAGPLLAGIVIALTLFVGHFAAEQADMRYQNQPEATVALIQGDTKATWDPDPNRSTRIMQRQSELTQQAVTEAAESNQKIDLVVWPESMFRTPMFTFDGKLSLPSELSADERYNAGHAGRAVADLARLTDANLLLGVDHLDYEGSPPEKREEWKVAYANSAALVDPEGTVRQIYDKMHRVPFGEYIPLFDSLPGLYFLTPIPGGIRPGQEPVAMPIDLASGERLTLCPNICYETVIPHVIRRQAKILLDNNEPADLLVNLTNNAWFWGSSELEMHLACNIFRAVENRTPMVIAANGGLSAVIDSAGRLLEVSPRQTEHVIVAGVPLDPKQSFYTRYGDWPAGLCLIATILIAIMGLAKKPSN